MNITAWIHWPTAVRLCFALCVVIVFAGLAPSKAWAQNQSARASFQLKDDLFQHPMTVIDAAGLNIVKERIAKGIEPQVWAVQTLLREADRALAFEPDPPTSMHIMGGYETNTNLGEMRNWLWRNRNAAYATALAFTYTEETKYADKAVEILNAWARKNTTFTGGDRGLQLGSWFSGMLYAADLLFDYPGWDREDRTRFQQWWRRNILPHVLDVMRKRSNNWKDAGVLGVLAAAVVLEDRDLLEEGLTELATYFDGDWKIVVDERGVYLPHEVVRNDGRSGVTYTAYSLTSIVQAMEIARHAGVDFWFRTTDDGANMQDLIEWSFLWDVKGRTFPWHPGPARSSNRKNPYEIAGNVYPISPAMTDWVKSSRPVQGAQGDEYVTLNKGDIPVEHSCEATGPWLRIMARRHHDKTSSLQQGDTITGPVTIEPDTACVEKHIGNTTFDVELNGKSLPPADDTADAWNINRGELGDGRHVLQMSLKRDDGRVIATRSVVFQVSNTKVVSPPDKDKVTGTIQFKAGTTLPEKEIKHVQIDLDDETIWDDTYMPDELPIDTVQIADGRHTVSIAVTTDGGAVSKASAQMTVDNWWSLVDDLIEPVETDWFGVIDRSRTIDKSDGWVYATDDGANFFGDGDRKTRKDTTSEYLVWEAPSLTEATVIMFARENVLPEVANIVAIETSPDGRRWTALPYELAVEGPAESGWYRLTAEANTHDTATDATMPTEPTDGEVTNIDRVRIVMNGGSAPADALYVGEVRLRGRNIPPAD